MSKLIILHEEGEDGNSMPDLQTPVQAVSKAVANLVRWDCQYIIPTLQRCISRVGRDTINSSQDMKMKSEMPKSLAAIEKASDFLMEASSSLKSDPYSQVNLILKTGKEFQAYQWVNENIVGHPQPDDICIFIWISVFMYQIKKRHGTVPEDIVMY